VAICYFFVRIMPLKHYLNLMRVSRLRRGIAIFLLAFAFFDMAVVDVFYPQLCGDEEASVSVAPPAKPSEMSSNKTASISGYNLHSKQNLGQPSTDEECFCCCSHIIPGVNVNVAVLNGAPQPHDTTIASLPSAPTYGAYHPPRQS
jgi:hypothetical protein